MEYKKTSEAWDNLLASILEVFSRVFHKGTSSRVLALVGVGVYEYMILQQSGLQGVEAAVAAAVGAITGVSFIGFKTAENIKKNGVPIPIPLPKPPMPTEPQMVKPVDIPSTSVPITPFDSEAFMDRVYSKVGKVYAGNINDQTVLYTAQSTMKFDWVFDNILAVDQCKQLILSLAKKAFQFKWGTTWEEETNRPTDGCTLDNMRERAIQKGQDYYAAYLEVMNSIKDLEP